MKKVIERRRVNPISQTFSNYLKQSITRVCVLISTLTGCFCAIYGLLFGLDLVQLSMLVGVILSAAFGGKYINKKLEAAK
jgi:hypothetical protein